MWHETESKMQKWTNLWNGHFCFQNNIIAAFIVDSLLFTHLLKTSVGLNALHLTTWRSIAMQRFVVADFRFFFLLFISFNFHSLLCTASVAAIRNNLTHQCVLSGNWSRVSIDMLDGARGSDKKNEKVNPNGLIVSIKLMNLSWNN